MGAQLISFPADRIVRTAAQQLVHSQERAAKAPMTEVDRLVEIIEREVAAGRLKFPARHKIPAPASPPSVS